MHASVMMGDIYSEEATKLIDDKFKLAKALTYMSIGK